MPSQISKMKFDQVGVDGIKVFLSDFGYMEQYRQEDLTKRFQSVLQKFGVASNTYVEDTLLPSSGGTDNTVYISPGTLITPNGGHIQLTSTYTFGINGGDVGKWVVAEYKTMDIDLRTHRESGVQYYMREVPTTGFAGVFYTTSSPPVTTGDVVYLGKITAISGNKPVVDTSKTNRQLLSVHNNTYHDFFIWLQGVLDSARTDFADLITNRYAEIVDLLDNKAMPDGSTVRTTSVTPKTPKNFRVTAIKPIKNDDLYQDTEVQAVGIKMAKKVDTVGYKEGVALVELSWNWNDVEGTGGNGTLTVTNALNSIGANYQFTLNELTDFRLYIEGNGDHYIISNAATVAGATVLQVRDAAGSVVDLTGINPSSSNPAIIHSDADEYSIAATPIIDTVLLKKNRINQNTKVASSPVPQVHALELPIRGKFKIEVMAELLGVHSGIGLLSSGSFQAYGAPVAYSSNLIVKLPNIPTAGSSVGVVATDVGFLITVVGFAQADGYEICWTTDNAGADFDDATHEKIIITHKKHAVSTTASQEYNIAVRPIQAGQVVADVSDWLSGTIVSGAGGRAPNEKIVPAININQIAAYVSTGSLVYYGADIYTLTVSPNPNWSTNKWVGRRFTDSAGLQMQVWKNTDDTIYVEEGTNFIGNGASMVAPFYFGNAGPVNNPGGSNFTPVIQQPRHVYTYNFVNDVLITKIEFDCEDTNGTPSVPVIIRIWQDGRASSSKMLEVNAIDTLFPQVADLSILGRYGNRKLYVDTWDPDNSGNALDVKGILTIFYRDILLTKEQDVKILQLDAR